MHQFEKSVPLAAIRAQLAHAKEELDDLLNDNGFENIEAFNAYECEFNQEEALVHPGNETDDPDLNRIISKRDEIESLKEQLDQLVFFSRDVTIGEGDEAVELKAVDCVQMAIFNVNEDMLNLFLATCDKGCVIQSAQDAVKHEQLSYYIHDLLLLPAKYEKNYQERVMDPLNEINRDLDKSSWAMFDGIWKDIYDIMEDASWVTEVQNAQQKGYTQLTRKQREDLRSILDYGSKGEGYWSDGYLDYEGYWIQKRVRTSQEWRIEPFWQELVCASMDLENAINSEIGVYRRKADRLTQFYSALDLDLPALLLEVIEAKLAEAKEELDKLLLKNGLNGIEEYNIFYQKQLKESKDVIKRIAQLAKSQLKKLSRFQRKIQEIETLKEQIDYLKYGQPSYLQEFSVSVANDNVSEVEVMLKVNVDLAFSSVSVAYSKGDNAFELKEVDSVQVAIFNVHEDMLNLFLAKCYKARLIKSALAAVKHEQLSHYINDLLRLPLEYEKYYKNVRETLGGIIEDLSGGSWKQFDVNWRRIYKIMEEVSWETVVYKSVSGNLYLERKELAFKLAVLGGDERQKIKERRDKVNTVFARREIPLEGRRKILLSLSKQQSLDRTSGDAHIPCCEMLNEINTSLEEEMEVYRSNANRLIQFYNSLGLDLRALLEKAQVVASTAVVFQHPKSVAGKDLAL